MAPYHKRYSLCSSVHNLFFIHYVHCTCILSGIIGVACGETYSFDERVDLSFRLLHSRSLILIWSFADPIHPLVNSLLKNSNTWDYVSLQCVCKVVSRSA